MSELGIYAELRSWQQGLAALLGFIALMSAAVWNFHLNRRRDAALRAEEANSVAVALYGEIALLRVRAAQIANSVARVYVAEGTGSGSSLKFDKHFVEANRLPELTLYKALAPKFGLLPSSLLLPITSFYENVQLLDTWVPRLVQPEDRPYTYSPLYVLHPTLSAVKEILPTLRKIEELVGISDKVSSKPLDVSDAEGVVAMEEERYDDG
jgi:hypothetical protein